MEQWFYDELQPEFGTEEGIKRFVQEIEVPVDGFNGKALKGVALFCRGLLNQVKKNAEKNGISLDEMYDREIKEMGFLLTEISRKFQKETEL